MSELRSLRKSSFAGRVWVGMRVSFFMVARRPRWEGEETRVLNASCSSCEA